MDPNQIHTLARARAALQLALDAAHLLPQDDSREELETDIRIALRTVDLLSPEQSCDSIATRA